MKEQIDDTNSKQCFGGRIRVQESVGAGALLEGSICTWTGLDSTRWVTLQQIMPIICQYAQLFLTAKER